MNRRIITVLALALALPSPALAEPSAAAKKDATEHFKRGLQLAENDPQAALVEFQRAYEIAPSFKILYNLGMVQRDLRDYRSAQKTLQRFLDEGGKQVDAAKKKEVEQVVKTLKGFVGAVVVTTNVEGATIEVDGEPASARDAYAVNAGKHKIVAHKEGYRDATQSVAVTGEETVKVALVLEALPKAPPPGALPPPPPPKPSQWDALSFAGIGVTAALAVGAGVTGGLALAGSEDLKKTGFVGPSAPESLLQKQAEVQALGITTDVLVGTAIVVLGATLIYTAVHTPSPKKAGRANPFAWSF